MSTQLTHIVKCAISFFSFFFIFCLSFCFFFLFLLQIDTAATDSLQPKSQKRRAPLLLKRKALTTGFFDSSKIKNDGRKGSTSNASGPIFGQPLEKCLSNDNAFGMSQKQKGSDDSGGNGFSHKLSRKSRSSITSLDNQLPLSSAISSDENYVNEILSPANFSSFLFYFCFFNIFLIDLLIFTLISIERIL